MKLVSARDSVVWEFAVAEGTTDTTEELVEVKGVVALTTLEDDERTDDEETDEDEINAELELKDDEELKLELALEDTVSFLLLLLVIVELWPGTAVDVIGAECVCVAR